MVVIYQCYFVNFVSGNILIRKKKGKKWDWGLGFFVCLFVCLAVTYLTKRKVKSIPKKYSLYCLLEVKESPVFATSTCPAGEHEVT